MQKIEPFEFTRRFMAEVEKLVTPVYEEGNELKVNITLTTDHKLCLSIPVQVDEWRQMIFTRDFWYDIEITPEILASTIINQYLYNKKR